MLPPLGGFLLKILFFIRPNSRSISCVSRNISKGGSTLSTLLIMVAAYGGYDLVMEAYHTALKEDYRFGTYGDAMLILDK